MKHTVYSFLFLALLALFACEDDGTYGSDKQDKDDTNYVVNEPSDGSIAEGVSGDFPVFLHEESDSHRLTALRKQQLGVYAPDDVRRMNLTFALSNWADLLQLYAADNTDLPAQISYEGTTYPYRVGVRYRGSAVESDDPTEKKSYTISVDYENSKQDITDYYTLILNGAYTDSSFMHEALYRQSIQKYIPSLQVNYINLHINNQDLGLYVNTQHPNARFLKEWFLSSNGSRWRAEPDAVGEELPQGTNGKGFSGLNYLGNNPNDYIPYYDLKTTHKDNPYEDIMLLAKCLHETDPDSMEAAISKRLDLDRTLWFLACENIFTDKDSYIHKGGTDYYLYWDSETGRMTPLEYDGNDTFSPEHVEWDPFYHADDERYPLLHKLLNVPSIRQRYLAHYRTILEETYNPATLWPRIDALAQSIDSAVRVDPTDKYSYETFLSAVQTLKWVVEQRHQFLTTHDSIAVSGLTLSDLKWTVQGDVWKTPTSTDTVTIEVAVAGGGVNSVYLCAGTGMLGPYRRLQMFDDGTHGDFVAADGVFTGRINPQAEGVRVRFYIEAVRGNAARTRSYYPSGAEHEVFTYVVSSEI